VFLQIRLHFS